MSEGGFWRDESGQDLTEYALLLVLIALVAVYYIVERTPAAPGDADSGGEEPVV